MLPISALDYDLPASLVATRAAEPRDSARLMVASRRYDSAPTHATIADLPSFLRSGDLLVFNTTRVLPARVVGRRSDTEGRVEGLFLSEDPARPGRWIMLVRAKRARPGVVLDLLASDESVGASLRLIEQVPDEPGAWAADLIEPTASTLDVLNRVGRTPLPPYILKARRETGVDISDASDRDRYQTVYAGRAAGSVAAPTAGLHFTPALLDRLASMGVQRADVVLHVGSGTFRPVETEFLEQHRMHAEHCEVTPTVMEMLRAAKREGRRVIAVGTTTARTIESYALALESRADLPSSVNTSLLIVPGYRWRLVDALLTNFHLPRSTLLAMVGAMFDLGLPRLLSLYRTAVERAYRFYSYGDAMLVLPD